MMCASARSTSASNLRAASALLKVPVKRRIIFGGGLLMKLRLSGHVAALPSCACGFPPMKRSSLYPSPVLRLAFQSQLPKPVGRPRLPCHHGWKSGSRPTLPVLQRTATTPAPATYKLPVSSVPCSPRSAYIIAVDSRGRLSLREQEFFRSQSLD